MNNTKLHSPLQIDVSGNLLGSEQIQNMDYKKLKKLYYKSCNIRAVALLFFIALNFPIIATFIFPYIEGIVRYGRYQLPTIVAFGGSIYQALLVPAGLLALSIFVAIGLIKRNSWGRFLGIVSCLVSLCTVVTGHVFGVLVGIFGLFAIISSPQLFGRNRVTHRELKHALELKKLDIATQAK